MELQSIQPLFSVLIANYNNGQYLEDCLKSIFAQTYEHWEIIIVDDASTDNSREIYQKYANDQRIRVYYNSKNKGCGYTKRKCVEYASGEICGFVDPDDAIDPVAIEIMMSAHHDHPDHSLIYSTHYVCDRFLSIQSIADYVGQIPVGQYSYSMDRPIISHFASFKMQKYTSTNGIACFYTKAVDKELYYKLEETGPVLFIDKPLYYYRHHLGGISLGDNAAHAYDFELTAKVKTILRNKQRRKIIHSLYLPEHQLINGILRVAKIHSKKNNILTGIKLLCDSLRFSPLKTLKIIGKYILK